jgi:hypothetical protein
MELKEFRTKMDSILDTTINDLFYQAQTMNNVDSGDISPIHQILVKKTQIILRELIIAQIYMVDENKEIFILGNQILQSILSIENSEQLIINEEKLPQ